MRLKSLFFSFTALAFLVACSNNATNNTAPAPTIEQANLHSTTEKTLEPIKEKIEAPKGPQTTNIGFSENSIWGGDKFYLFVANVDNFDWENPKAIRKAVPVDYPFVELQPNENDGEPYLYFAQDVKFYFNQNSPTEHGYKVNITSDDLQSVKDNDDFIKPNSFLKKLKSSDKLYVSAAKIGVYNTFILTKIDTKNNISKLHYIESPYVYDETIDDYR